MAAPTTVDALANFMNGLIAAMITGDEVVLKAFITAQVPALEGPFIHIFTNEVIDIIGEAVRKNLALISTAIVIDLQTYGEMSAIYKAFEKLQENKNDPNAQAIFIKAAAALAHSTGSATNA